MGWFRRHYGAGPFHLVGLLACFAVAAYAVTRVFAQGGWRNIFLWFVGCLILHDLIGWPFYTLADRWLLRIGRGVGRRAGRRRQPLVPWINHVRFPTVISAVLLLISFPLIFRLSNGYYQASTGFDENVYLENWVVVTGILGAASAVIYLLRLALARRRAGSGPRGPGPEGRLEAGGP